MSKNRLPWLVSLQYNNRSHFCGATLISDLYILSAGHCFENKSVRDGLQFTIALGAHNTSNYDEIIYAEPEAVIIHEKYKRIGEGIFYDIALIHTKKRITFNEKINPICFPSIGKTLFDNLFVAGWGYVTEFGPKSDVPNILSLPNVTQDACIDFHGEVITENHICAGGQEDQDTCEGDSGGPLMTRINKRVYHVGVVSYGFGCGRPDFYGVYTRTTKYLNWIEQNTNGSKWCLPNLKNKPSPPKPITDTCGKAQTGLKYPWQIIIRWKGRDFLTGILVKSNLVLSTAIEFNLL